MGQVHLRKYTKNICVIQVTNNLLRAAVSKCTVNPTYIGIYPHFQRNNVWTNEHNVHKEFVLSMFVLHVSVLFDIPLLACFTMYTYAYGKYIDWRRTQFRFLLLSVCTPVLLFCIVNTSHIAVDDSRQRAYLHSMFVFSLLEQVHIPIKSTGNGHVRLCGTEEI